jgi:hypothetical protein
MYYLIEIKEQSVKIVANVFKAQHKKTALLHFLKDNNIKLLDNDSQPDGQGLYAVQLTDDSYRLYRRVTEDDGLIFYGREYDVDVSYLNFVYYLNDIEGIDDVNDSILKLGLKEKIEEDERKERIRKDRLKEQKKREEEKEELPEGPSTLQ